MIYLFFINDGDSTMDSRLCYFPDSVLGCTEGIQKTERISLQYQTRVGTGPSMVEM